MGFCACSIKYLLFFFNLVVALGGLTIVIVGAIIQWYFGSFDEFLGSKTSASSIVLIVVGGFMFTVAFLGCCGAIRESQCMLLTYASVLGVVFALLVTGVILAALYISNLDENLQNTMTNKLDDYYTNSAVKDSWDLLQNNFHCCGVTGPSDWPPNEVPESCNDYTAGCYDKLFTFIRKIQLSIAVVAGGLAGITVLGIIFSCILAGSIKKKKWNRG